MSVSFDDLVPQTDVDFSDLVPAPQPQIPSGAYRDAVISGSAAAKGLANFAGLPGDTVDALNSYIAGPTERALSTLGSLVGPSWGTPQPLNFGQADPQDQNIFPTSQQIGAPLQAAGIINRPDAVPQDTFEKYLDKGMQGVGGNLPLAAISGGVAPAMRMASQGLFSGLGDQLASQFMPDSKTAQLLASVGGSMAGGGVSNLAEKTANAITNDTSPVIKAYQEAGVTPRMVGDVSGSPTMKTLQNIGGNQGAQQTLDEFGQSVDGLANSMGTSHTLQEAGQIVQDHAKDWLANFKDQSSQMHNAVADAIGNDTQVPIGNLQSTIARIKGAGSNNDALKSFLSSGLSDDVDNIVSKANKGIPQSEAFPNAQNTPTLSFSDVKQLRSRVGEYLENPSLMADAAGSQAKQVYAALSKDMTNAAFMSPNPKALPMLQQANAYTAQGHNFIDNVLSPILSKDPSAAASQLLSSGTKGGETLQALRQNMPDATNELAAVSLRRASAGQSSGAAGNAVSPSRWLSNYDPTRRLSPEGFQALYPDAATQSKMSALDTVAQNMRDTEKYANHSGTAGHAAAYAAVPAAIEGGVQGYHMAGIPGAMVGAAAAGISPFAIKPLAAAITNNKNIARFMSSPISQGNFSGLGSNILPAISSQGIPFSLAPPR